MNYSTPYKATDWLPTSVKEAKAQGWTEADVVLFSGDAYVDHPSFGTAVIGRMLQAEGLNVAIVPQPNWQDDLRDFKKFGKPKMFFAVSAGVMDSMVNHYTANRRRRSDDAYTPDGRAGGRPDYAVTVYTKILKELFPDVPVIIGGVEASLRRFTHYDYWSNTLKPSILADTNADLLIYGMGEKPLTELIRLLKKGVPLSSIKTLPQSAVMIDKDAELPKNKEWTDLNLASYEDCLKDKMNYAKNFKHIEQESNSMNAKRLIQITGEKKIIVNPPYNIVSEAEIDKAFDLPYTRMPHPRYHSKPPIPAYEMIKFSINIHRGCFGGCAFCTISAHQGKFIVNRSEKSIMQEVNKVVEMPDFKGYITDIGGPSANMYGMKGFNLTICSTCKRPSCIFPAVCKNLNTDNSRLLNIYNEIRKHPEVKKAFIGSGIRYDLFFDKEGNMKPEGHKYIEQLTEHHVSGRLKVAPEHTSDNVLTVMRKPKFQLFYKFKKKFEEVNKKLGLNQQLIPYFISSHPGSDEIAMAELAAETKALDFKLEQVQDFTPTPMTVATVIYYSGVHPYSLKPYYTAINKEEKLQQRQYFFWYKPEEKQNIIKSLRAKGREDLITKLFDKEGKIRK